MAAKTQMDVEEYLHTSFDGADCEYLEGEIVERNLGRIQDARVQAWLGHCDPNQDQCTPLSHPRSGGAAPIGRARRDPKVRDYLSMGVGWIWIIDPYEKTAMVYSGASPSGEQVDMPRTENPVIAIPLLEVLNPRR